MFVRKCQLAQTNWILGDETTVLAWTGLVNYQKMKAGREPRKNWQVTDLYKFSAIGTL